MSLLSVGGNPSTAPQNEYKTARSSNAFVAYELLLIIRDVNDLPVKQ